jgi:hypothetical protein
MSVCLESGPGYLTRIEPVNSACSLRMWCHPSTGKHADTCLRATEELPGPEGNGPAPRVVEANTMAENQGAA